MSERRISLDRSLIRCLVSVAAEGSATSWSITAGVPEVVGHIPEVGIIVVVE